MRCLRPAAGAAVAALALSAPWLAAACTGASPDSAVAIGPEPRKPAPAAGQGAADAGAGAPKSAEECPHGALEDPHRGFVRCLEPGEADAGWLPPKPPEPGEADAGLEDAGDAGGEDAGAPAPLPVVEFGSFSFQNGEVPNAEKNVRKLEDKIAECVAEAGGLSGKKGSMKVQFLVRFRARAEGVEVLSSKNVPEEALACVRLALKNRAVGAPSSDPVGVTFTVNLRAPD